MKRTFLLIIGLWGLLMGMGCFAQDSERSLKDALKDYSAIQSDIKNILKQKCPECEASIGTSSSTVRFCSLRDFCQRPEIKKDEPVLYKNAKGEKVLNTVYYNLRSEINVCLKEKYSDEIEAKKEEWIEKLQGEYLKKMKTANARLLSLMSKYSQGNAVAKVSAEILNFSLEAGLNGEDLGWESKGTPKDKMLELVTKAEKKLKIKLIPEIKQTLVEIRYLKNNPTYMDEVQQLERGLIPEIVPDDPLYDWKKLTDEKAAGGAQALQKNRQLIIDKAQSAYNIFEQTRQDIIAFLDSKKTTQNMAMIERAKDKVKTIRFNPPRLTDKLSQYCQGPNAFYTAKNHSLTICPQMLGVPQIALIETIAHEIAHSFDTCNLSQSFIEKRGPAIVEDAPFEIEIKTAGPDKNYSTLFYGEDPVMKGVVQNFVPYKDHPFVSTMSCLRDPQSVGVASPDIETVKNEARLTLQKLKEQTGGTDKNNTEIKYLTFFSQHADDFFAYVQGCNLGSGGEKGLMKSQMQEAFADKISSEIVAKKLANVTRGVAEKEFLELALSYGPVCPNRSSLENRLLEFAHQEGCKNFYADRTYENKMIHSLELVDKPFDPHPQTEIRLNKNFLAHPGIRKALECPKDKGVKYCE